MYERFDEQTRLAVENAFEEARSFGHGEVGTEHLLVGLLTVPDAAARSLLSCGATLEGCRAKVAEAAAGKLHSGVPRDLRLTDRAARALERAGRLSLRQRSPHVGTDHVLLSILDVEGTAGQVLRGLSVDLVGLREALKSGGNPKEEEEEGEPPAPDPEPAAAGLPCCPVCRSSLDISLAHRPVISQGHDGQSATWIIAYCSSCGTAIGGAEARVRGAR